MADEKKFYPKGEVSLGGTLHEVTNFRVRSSDGKRLTHSLTRSPAGWSRGNVEVAGSFSTEIPAGGAERDWFQKWLAGSPDALAVKLPGETRTLYILVAEESIDLRMEGPVTREISYIGWWGTKKK